MKTTIFICIVLLLNLPLASRAESKIYGIYSNMHHFKGDISGYEILILHNGKPGKCSDSVLFQVAEGWPQNPELLDCCGCSNSHIEFVSSKWGKFVGHIENDTLSGEFVGPHLKINLPKGQSFWQQY